MQPRGTSSSFLKACSACRAIYDLTYHCIWLTNRDKLGRRRTEICAIDALPFKFKFQRLEQFGEEYLMREINKALVGFRPSPITNSEWGMLRPEEEESSRLHVASLIATGNSFAHYIVQIGGVVHACQLSTLYTCATRKLGLWRIWWPFTAKILDPVDSSFRVCRLHSR